MKKHPNDPPPCAGLWFLFDSTLLSDHKEAVKLCAKCHIVKRCQTILEEELHNPYASSGPRGTWAGRLYTNEPRVVAQ